MWKPKNISVKKHIPAVADGRDSFESISLLKFVPRCDDFKALDSMTNDLYSHTRDFSRICFTYCVKYEKVLSNMGAAI